jgi:hypothetical protein
LYKDLNRTIEAFSLFAQMYLKKLKIHKESKKYIDWKIYYTHLMTYNKIETWKTFGNMYEE